jgi:DNA-binding response OmpR family regulator
VNVLLIEDEQEIADFTCNGLTDRGFSVTHCSDGHSGFDSANSKNFDIIVLDIMLPGRDGLDILKSLRSLDINTPVILLTARNELDDRIQGLEAGADDYLAKPFFVEELIARIQALRRRIEGIQEYIIEVGALQLNCMTRKISCYDQYIDLTTREFTLLEYLMRSPEQVFTKGQILEHVWGYDFDPCTNVVAVCVKRIRHKIASIDKKGATAASIESVRGTGYRLIPR